MYEETDVDGRRKYTVAQIANECGVTRPTIYRNLQTVSNDVGLAKAAYELSIK
jgi:predicted transcriptional regulator